MSVAANSPAPAAVDLRRCPLAADLIGAQDGRDLRLRIRPARGLNQPTATVLFDGEHSPKAIADLALNIITRVEGRMQPPAIANDTGLAPDSGDALRQSAINIAVLLGSFLGILLVLWAMGYVPQPRSL